jgi:hypothetical protein
MTALVASSSAIGQNSGKSESPEGRIAGRKVRFGAYGEPSLLPLSIVASIAAVAKGWTGYTHQWRKSEYAGYRECLMASSDSPADFADAQAAGWRTFRVRTAGAEILPGEIMCPASPEGGNKSQCNRCGLCNGVRADQDKRKSTSIIVHGVRSKHFLEIGEIKAAA